MTKESEYRIRPYEERDRAAVRYICFETGYMGESIGSQWADWESQADFFSSYYTDHEPASALVAELDGEVTGYLLGCVATSRAAIPNQMIFHHLIKRGLLVRPGTAGFAWRTAVDIVSDAAHQRIAPVAIVDDRWPAHFHIDILAEGRGHGLGRTMVSRWLAMLRNGNVAGCHLVTLEDNRSAVHFFRTMGFEPTGKALWVPGLRTPTHRRHRALVMTQVLR